MVSMREIGWVKQAHAQCSSLKVGEQPNRRYDPAPCAEFSQFAAHQPTSLSGEALKEVLQFLGDERRGFYATFPGQTESVQAGDRVLLVE